MENDEQVDVETLVVEDVAPVSTPVVDAEKFKKELADKNREAQNLRKRLNELEAAETARKTAALSETERLAEELKTAKAQAVAATAEAQNIKLERAIETAARDFNISEKLAMKLVKDDLILDDSGKPTNLTELLTALITENPNLVTVKVKPPVIPDVSATNPARVSGLTIDKIKAMTPTEMAKNMTQVEEYLRQNRK